MISRYEVTLDGIELSSVHDDLMILDIQHTPAQKQAITARKAKGNGVYISNLYQEQTTVTILFELHIYDIKERQRVCQQIATMAMNCKILKTNDRPGQQLHTVCDQPPAIDSALQWTSPLSMVFSAYSLPFWEETEATTAFLNETVDTAILSVPGNAGETFVDADITAVSNLSSLTISAGSTTITLSGINVAEGEVINVRHDENGILSIKSGDISLLKYRTASSSDDLLVISGTDNTVAISANNPVSCEIWARGVWL